ncbi:MAG: hypothetical protein BGO70_05095 [Bacteroidetes bacterium 43-93]|nr:hypothetical protein [Bacteroidota bacterium]MBS1778560.1 hypothetical protein [Bacteroidota bacterium]OJW96780.1 MAG: hypothetical protein BGO70_05095 [Bacteroidetes bacterium 43-93]
MKRFILSLALLTPFFAYAQPHHEVGLTAGVANYYGDLQNKMFPKEGYRPMAGIVYKYFFNPHLGIRFGASYASVTAADSLSDVKVKQDRNLRFATNIFEVHGGFELNILQIEKDRSKITPYIFAGLSIFHFNPYTDGLNGEKVYLRPLSTEGQGIPVYPDRKEYKLTNIAFPVGGGMKFLVGKQLFITTELGFRYTNTDYLDDVSKSYVNLDTLRAYKGQQAVNLAYRGDEKNDWYSKMQNETNKQYPNYKYQRGDSKSNDWYWFGNVTITIYLDAFGNAKRYWQADCPAFRR